MNVLQSIIAKPQLEAMKELASSMPPGAFCEIGVFHGGSAQYLYEVALRQGRELHLFDTFCGTPVYTPGLDGHKTDDEFADPDAIENIRSLMPMAAIHVGYYPSTHPSALKDVAFVHCDCDQYLSYRSVIEYMWPLVVSGGVLLFDDYPYLTGARRAVEENFSVSDLKKCFARYYVVKA